jgi:hypothetical protein
MGGQNAWDQLTKAEQDLIAGRLVLENAEKAEETGTETPEEAFNQLLNRSGLDKAEAVANVVAALRNMLDVTGAREDRRIWDDLQSIDYLQVGKDNVGDLDYNIGYMFTVRGGDRAGTGFTAILGNNGYLVNMRFELFGFSVSERTLLKWSGEQPHKVSARYLAAGAWLVVPHWVQQEHYASNKFDLHFDPANSACTQCNSSSRLKAAKMHCTMHLPATETRRLLQQQKPQTGLKVTTP